VVLSVGGNDVREILRAAAMHELPARIIAGSVHQPANKSGRNELAIQ
jgi:hypothetical protein